MDIVSIDVERAYRNGSFPSSTVRIVLAEHWDGSLSVLSTAINLRDHPACYDSMQMISLEDAYYRMTEYIR